MCRCGFIVVLREAGKTGSLQSVVRLVAGRGGEEVTTIYGAALGLRSFHD